MRVHLAMTSLTGAVMPPVILAVRPELDHPALTPAVARTVEGRLGALLLRRDFTTQIQRLIAGSQATGH
jgi:hypothetical protein